MSIFVPPGETSWAQLFIRYWKRTETSLISKAGDKEIVEGEIERRINPKPPNSELCDVLRWLSGPECSQKYAPTLQELIIAIHTWRKRERLNDAPPAEECTYCYCGKIPHYPDYHPAWTLDDFAIAYSCTIPCLCSAGRRAMLEQLPWKNIHPEKQITLTETAREAMQALDARSRLIKAAPCSK